MPGPLEKFRFNRIKTMVTEQAYYLIPAAGTSVEQAFTSVVSTMPEIQLFLTRFTSMDGKSNDFILDKEKKIIFSNSSGYQLLRRVGTGGKLPNMEAVEHLVIAGETYKLVDMGDSTVPLLDKAVIRS